MGVFDAAVVGAGASQVTGSFGLGKKRKKKTKRKMARA